jgi:uncharacterized protein YaeQ
MAPKSTVYKAELEVADLDRQYYAAHSLVLACHPSETETRMMLGLAAFALNAHERLAFSRGLAETEEPDLWRRDLAGDLELWIELGHPDERRLARACGKSRSVVVYTYSASPELWWEPASERLWRFRNLRVYGFDPEEAKALQGLVRRGMSLSATIQDGELWLRDDEGGEARLALRAIFEGSGRR